MRLRTFWGCGRERWSDPSAIDRPPDHLAQTGRAHYMQIT